MPSHPHLLFAPCAGNPITKGNEGKEDEEEEEEWADKRGISSTNIERWTDKGRDKL